MIRKIATVIGTILLFATVALCLAAVIVPRYLDRIYYHGPVSSHFDGQRFFNPDGNDTLRPPAGKSRGGFITRYLLGRDARPKWPDHVAVTQGKPPARVTDGRMLVTWVGHASVLVQADGLNILTDPVWSDHAGPFGLGPKRVAEPGIAFADLPKIDLVLVSHNHYDHLDLATLKRLWERDHPLIVTSLGNDSVIAQSGAKAVARDWGGTVNVKPGVEVVVTRAHHWSSRWFTDRNRALWSGFVVRLPHGNLFFAGDTGFGDGKWPAEAAAYGPIRLALIPIGAFRFVPGQMGIGSHIGPVDAVRVFDRLHAAHAIGIHWGTFRLSWEGYDTPPRLLTATAKCDGLGDAFTTIPIGRPTEIPDTTTPPASRDLSRPALLQCLDTPAVRAMR
ncbi:MBL fold metallo-hydrolase [Stakelama sediminis]|uniref:L-ascorbate metabolism protein UlaG (Beta-lactamase superfamily) n=1 Tax=Stakelama sediminis TaxID=463200 RepID=A0A840YZW4_9SPHN|nr:MBL fold metallo-hydrolase [Stakelama sediminis]MBB5719050.1 L-ascorbate metabolism protein UlaG (beta-lactamase superfamily) [Stakelama sediminis]